MSVAHVILAAWSPTSEIFSEKRHHCKRCVQRRDGSAGETMLRSTFRRLSPHNERERKVVADLVVAGANTWSYGRIIAQVSLDVC